ncbi:zinc finger protein 883-like [Hyalella azteca]|uniref:Zinc finger protein 883-like n=1 Tax=Hyalella azteca TaxID=294128 RepID=A0A8B7N276_HYAAZ|nr:zinc finger protein 883-like [Hyalella azteca]
MTAATMFAAILPSGHETGETCWQRYLCYYCNSAAKRFSSMQQHIIENHQERLYECELCFQTVYSGDASGDTQGLVFQKRSDLILHLEEHLSNGERRYTCGSCNKRFCLARQIRQHKRHHLAKSVMCPHCPRRFRSEVALQEHIYNHTGCRPFRCFHCKKRFSSRYTLKVHNKTHLVRERNHRCIVCRKEFLSYHHLVEHMHVHEDSKNFPCDVCGKAFATVRSLELHKVIHTGVKNYSCKLCNKMFARKGEVEDHERIHTGEKPFQCEICGATFSQRSNLQSHKRATHLKEKKHQCPDCDKAFKRRRLLVCHQMSVHTGERPYKCEICSAAFVYPEHFKKHLRIHTGEKPFKCEICGKAFNSRDNRNAHKFIHSERKPYECTLCNTGFMRKPMLMTHLLQHDQNLSQPKSCVRVNPPSVADEPWSQNHSMATDENEFYESSESLKIVPEELEGEVQLVNNEEVEVVSRPLHIIQTDGLPRYLIQSSDRSSFLASIQGQVLKVRPEAFHVKCDGVHYELSDNAPEAEDVESPTANPLGVQTSTFQLQLDDEDDLDQDELKLQNVRTVGGEIQGISCVSGVVGSQHGHDNDLLSCGTSQEDNNALLSRSFQFDGPIKVYTTQGVVTVPGGKQRRVASNRTMWNEANTE